VRDDGKLLVMTYLKSQDIYAWSIYETQGEYEGVIALQKDKYDDVYVIVNRDGGRFVELFKQELAETEDVSLAWYVDSGLQYNGNKTTELVIASNTATSATDVFVASNVGDYIVIPNVDPEEEADRYEILTFTDTKNVILETVADQTVQAWSLAVNEFSGLDHLEGQEVVALCDGDVEKGFTVSAGKITLEDSCSIATVGLGYESYIKTINYDTISSKGGSTVAKTRNMVKAIFDVYRSRGWRWKTSTVDEWIEHKDQDGLLLGEDLGLLSGKQPIDILTTTNINDNLFIGTNNPLPLNILNVTVVIQYGENL
jgi:hypothetical protein